MRYFFRVEYEGTNYGGWQYQPNADTIQAQLERAFSIAARQECKVVGAGRTDAGVHARGQGAHIDFPDEIDRERMIASVNGLLPRDIAIYNIQAVPGDFHARYGAIRRTYRFRLTTRKSPLLWNRAWFVRQPVDWEKVQASSESLLGTHDFSSFCAANTCNENKICTVEQVKWQQKDTDRVFIITANRYIYKMVRTIVGTLIDIGRGELQMSLSDIIASQDRTQAGATAPPFGLCLEYVEYPEGVS